jgi:hypothetical protein
MDLMLTVALTEPPVVAVIKRDLEKSHRTTWRCREVLHTQLATNAAITAALSGWMQLVSRWMITEIDFSWCTDN